MVGLPRARRLTGALAWLSVLVLAKGQTAPAPAPTEKFDPSTVPIVGDGILGKVMGGGGDDSAGGGGDDGGGGGERTAPFMDGEDEEPDFKFTDNFKENPWREVPPDAKKQSVSETGTESDSDSDSGRGTIVDEQGKYPSAADYPTAGSGEPFDPSTVPIVGGGILGKVMGGGGDDSGGDNDGSGGSAPFMDDEDKEPDFKFTDNFKDSPWREVPPDAMKQSADATEESSSVDGTSGKGTRSLLSVALVVAAAGVAYTAGSVYYRRRFPGLLSTEEEEEERAQILPAVPAGAYGATSALVFTPCRRGTGTMLDLGGGVFYAPCQGADGDSDMEGGLQHITPRRQKVGEERSAL